MDFEEFGQSKFFFKVKIQFYKNYRITGLHLITVLCARLLVTVAIIISAIIIHKKFVDAVMNIQIFASKPIPIGKLMNRFTSDIAIIDTTILRNILIFVASFTFVITEVIK